MSILKRLFARSNIKQDDTKIRKVRGGGLANPVYLKGVTGKKLTDLHTNITNLSLDQHVRWSPTMSETIKKLVINSPDLSHAIESKIKAALSPRFTALVYDNTGRIDPAGVELVQSFLMKINYGAVDYKRFSRSRDIRSIAAGFLYDSFRYGGGMLELVLGKSRLPAYPRVVPVRKIEWKEGNGYSYPVYKSDKGDIDLDYPTILYSSTIQDEESPYLESPLMSAIQVALWDVEFTNDLRKAATKNLFQRLLVTINTEKFLETLPPDVRMDAKKKKEYMDTLVTELDARMKAMDPEDALVLFDLLEADTIADANRSEDRSIRVLQDVVNGKISAGSKILPSIIGRGDSSGAASTESMLFLKNVSSSQVEFNILFSRMLTLVLRLYGSRSYCSFNLEEVNLRPHLELASFRAIEQSSLYEQLSLGQIDDIECSLRVTGSLPPKGYKNLAGTMFKFGKADVSGNNYSNTSVSADGKPDSTQSQKQTDPDNKGVKSGNK